MHDEGALAGMGGIDGLRIRGSLRFSFSQAPRPGQAEKSWSWKGA